RDVHGCPVDRRHVTSIVYEEIKIDLFGSELGDFVPEMFNQIVSKRFAERLKTSKLSGYQLRPIVRVKVNQSRAKGPELLYLEFTGKGGFDRRLKIRNGKNLCPYCSQEPVVCAGCGEIQRECLNCGKKTLYLPNSSESSDKRGFRLEGYPPEVPVVEAKEWDGSDWFTCGGAPFIGNRAKEWLERTHTYPIEVKKALLNVEGAQRPTNK